MPFTTLRPFTAQAKTYDKGILTITVPIQETKEATRRIPIEH